MKKIIVFALLLIIATTTFSQPTTKPAPAFKTDYLKKSKNRKTEANIFMATGVSSVLVAFLIPRKEKLTYTYADNNSSSWYNIFGPDPVVTGSYYKKSNAVRSPMVGFGILSALISIPMYFASYHYKMKAMRLSFKNETVPQLQKSSFINRTVPSLALKISL
jgi:hypothetical protein